MQLDLLVHVRIEITDERNALLEQGDEDAYLQLEIELKNKLNHGHANDAEVGAVSQLQIEDAGPYNDAGQWEPSKFTGRIAGQ